MLTITYWLMLPCIIVFDCIPEAFNKKGLLEIAAIRSPMLYHILHGGYIAISLIVITLIIYIFFH